jgi:hypothetical protein
VNAASIKGLGKGDGRVCGKMRVRPALPSPGGEGVQRRYTANAHPPSVWKNSANDSPGLLLSPPKSSLATRGCGFETRRLRALECLHRWPQFTLFAVVRHTTGLYTAFGFDSKPALISLLLFQVCPLKLPTPPG